MIVYRCSGKKSTLSKVSCVFYIWFHATLAQPAGAISMSAETGCLHLRREWQGDFQ